MFKETQYKSWFKLNRPRERALKQFKCLRPQCVKISKKSTLICDTRIKDSLCWKWKVISKLLNWEQLDWCHMPCYIVCIYCYLIGLRAYLNYYLLMFLRCPHLIHVSHGVVYSVTFRWQLVLLELSLLLTV